MRIYVYYAVCNMPSFFLLPTSYYRAEILSHEYQLNTMILVGCGIDERRRISGSRTNRTFERERRTTKIMSNTCSYGMAHNTYLTKSDEYSYVGSISCPSSPTAFVISNIARIETTVIHTDDMAIYRPGQILIQTLTEYGRLQACVPSSEAKHSLRISNVWIQLTVAQEALRFEGTWVGIHILVEVRMRRNVNVV